MKSIKLNTAAFENINGQWFEVVTGKNETEVAIKIDKAFGKGTRFEIINKFKLM